MHEEDIGANVLYNCGNEYVFGSFNPQRGNDSSYGLIPLENVFPPKKFDGTVIDGPAGTGNSGASKGFFDAQSGRYLHWTWIWEGFANASGSTSSIWGWDSTASVTRELRADLASQTLVFYPLEELASLRTAQLAAVEGQRLSVGKVTPLVGSDGTVVQGNTLDIELEVRWAGQASRPAGVGPIPHGRLVLSILGAEDGSEETQVVIDTAYNAGWSTLMPNTDLPCDAAVAKEKGWCDGNCTKPLASAAQCQAICNANVSCVGFAYIDAQKMCCQKRWVAGKVANPGATAGVKPQVIEQELAAALVVDRSRSSTDPTLVQTAAGCSNCTLFAPLRAVAGDGALTLRVLVDVSVLEAYAMHGRAHIATRAYPHETASTRVGLGWFPRESGGPTAIADVRVWRMGAGVEWLA